MLKCLKTKCSVLTVPISPGYRAKFLFDYSHSGPLNLPLFATQELSFNEGLSPAEYIQFANYDYWASFLIIRTHEFNFSEAAHDGTVPLGMCGSLCLDNLEAVSLC